jgi:hypothetical protein
MKIMRDFLVVLISLCLAATLFLTVPIKSSPTGTGAYDPWLDTNDDGKIDMKDVAAEARAFGSFGTPINKTEMLLNHETRITDLEGKVGPLKMVAAGYVYSDGTVAKGYNIQSVVWNVNRYEINLIGINYWWANFTTIVTCGSGTAHFATVNSIGGITMLVYLHDTAGNYVQDHFQFVTYELP